MVLEGEIAAKTVAVGAWLWSVWLGNNSAIILENGPTLFVIFT